MAPKSGVASSQRGRKLGPKCVAKAAKREVSADAPTIEKEEKADTSAKKPRNLARNTTEIDVNKSLRGNFVGYSRYDVHHSPGPIEPWCR